MRIIFQSLFADSVIYPGIIGKSCKYKTFHELIDYLLVQIGEFNSFKFGDAFSVYLFIIDDFPTDDSPNVIKLI